MRIRHDIHTHTFFSSCSNKDPNATIPNYIEKAAELGHAVLGISNHMWDEKVPGASLWYKGQNVDYVLQEKSSIPQDTLGIKLLFGAEVEYCGMTDTLGITAETAKKFDYIIVPNTHLHFKNFVMPHDVDTVAARQLVAGRIEEIAPELRPEIINRMIARISRADALTFYEPTHDFDKFVADFLHSSFDSLLAHPELVKMAQTTPTIIAHPFSGGGRAAQEKLDKDRLFAQFSKAAKMNVAMDLNVAQFGPRDETNYMNTSTVMVMRIALAAGCKFAFGTDAHTIERLEIIRNGDFIADAIGLTEKDFIDIVR